MSGENGGDGQLSLSAQDEAQAGQPLVEMGHNVGRLVALSRVLQRWTRRIQH